MTIIDSTNGADAKISSGIEMANRLILNFSTMANDGATRLSVAQFEALMSPPDPNVRASAGAFTRPQDPDRNGNGIAEIYFLDSADRARDAAVQAFHETLHHDKNIDKVVAGALRALRTGGLANLTRIEFASALEKVVSSTVEPGFARAR